MKLIILLVLSDVSFALFPYYTLPDETIDFVAQKTAINTVGQVKCYPPAFSNCQFGVTDSLGLDPQIGVSSGTQFFMAINGLIDNSPSAESLVNECTARQDFYSCMGSYATPCLNLQYLIQSGISRQNAFDYIRTWKGLDLLCTNLRTVSLSWPCIQGVPSTNSYKDCLKNYKNPIKPNELCGDAQKVGRCMAYIYGQACYDEGVSHFGCLNFQDLYRNQTCPTLSCL